MNVFSSHAGSGSLFSAVEGLVEHRVVELGLAGDGGERRTGNARGTIGEPVEGGGVEAAGEEAVWVGARSLMGLVIVAVVEEGAWARKWWNL